LSNTRWGSRASVKIHHAAVERVAQDARRASPGSAKSPELAERGPQEDLGLQDGVDAVVDEDPVHLRRRQLVGERRRDEPA
jgi:hypothetical protein